MSSITVNITFKSTEDISAIKTELDSEMSNQNYTYLSDNDGFPTRQYIYTGTAEDRVNCLKGFVKWMIKQLATSTVKNITFS